MLYALEQCRLRFTVCVACPPLSVSYNPSTLKVYAEEPTEIDNQRQISTISGQYDPPSKRIVSALLVDSNSRNVNGLGDALLLKINISCGHSRRDGRRLLTFVSSENWTIFCAVLLLQ